MIKKNDNIDNKRQRFFLFLHQKCCPRLSKVVVKKNTTTLTTKTTILFIPSPKMLSKVVQSCRKKISLHSAVFQFVAIAVVLFSLPNRGLCQGDSHYSSTGETALYRLIEGINMLREKTLAYKS